MSTVAEGHASIGDNLQRCRRYRGMSLQVLADRAGLSKSFLSMVENGQRRLDRRSHLGALADALEVAVSDLTGQPYSPPPQPNGEGGHGMVPRMRGALLGSSLEEPADVPTSPVAELAEETGRVEQLCADSDYGAFGRLLPGLVPALHVTAATADSGGREEALRCLVRAYHATFYLLKDLGYLDLAQVAVQQARDAAARLDDPALTGLAAFVRTHALIPAGVCKAALSNAERAADQIQDKRTVRTVGEVYGMLHLSAALVCVSLNRTDDAQAHLAEAAETAEHLGEGNAYGLHFGPTNVNIWKVATSVELGEGGKAAEIAATVTPELIPSQGRQASFFADWGRGLGQLGGHDREAIVKLRQAEKLAPEQIRNNPLTRETVTHLLRRERATAGGRELRGLAYRMGVS